MYVIIWKFGVRHGLEDDFESVYGPEGVWAQFFRRGDGYVGTELLRDASVPGQYVTIDRWESRAAHENFRRQFAEGYRAIDQECEVLTDTETELGTFEVVEPKVLGSNIPGDDKS